MRKRDVSVDKKERKSRWLQWGRNFIVAETRCSGPSNSPAVRRFNGAATLSLRKQDNSHDLYGRLVPLQWGRNFIVAETHTYTPKDIIQLLASMGPQLYRCGNTSTRPISMGWTNLLQWGRNFIVAETSHACRTLPHRRRRFNGAATLSLRKQRCVKKSCRTKLWLQWGRNFIVAETQRAYSQRPDVKELQWGRNFIVAETKPVGT